MNTQDLISHAFKKGWAYHGTDRFKDYFYPNISKYFGVFKGSKRVLDIGCCCGLFSLGITEHADSCLGIDHDPKYLANFQYVKEKSGANIDSIKCEIKDFAKAADSHEFDAAFAANVLYHLDEETIELLESKILPKCKKVLFFSRENKPKMKNSYQLYNWQKIVELLERNGFKTTRLDSVDELYTDYSTGYKKGVQTVNRSVERSHTDSVLVPVFGEK